MWLCKKVCFINFKLCLASSAKLVRVFLHGQFFLLVGGCVGGVVVGNVGCFNLMVDDPVFMI